MNSIIIDIVLTRDQYLDIYRGAAHLIHAHGRDGRSVQFPASILQPYVTHEGVRGSFEIHFGTDNKFSHIERIG